MHEESTKSAWRVHEALNILFLRKYEKNKYVAINKSHYI